jgi:hypothetical protein
MDLSFQDIQLEKLDQEIADDFAEGLEHLSHNFGFPYEYIPHNLVEQNLAFQLKY